MAEVYVQNKSGNPLMPTTRCGHVRILLKGMKHCASQCVVIHNNTGLRFVD